MMKASLKEKTDTLLYLAHNDAANTEALLRKKFVINEEEKILLKIFIEKIPAAIAIFDHNLNYLITSERWIQETNAPITDLSGKRHYDVVPDVPQKWRKIHARCLNGEHLKCEEDVFKRADGSVEWLRWEILPWYTPEGSIGGIIMFIEHITKRKLTERKMKEMIVALNQSNAELERYAHICAHDLHEPLRTIGNYCQLLERDFNNDLSPHMTIYLGKIVDSVKHMDALVNGILAYSQFDSPSLHMTKCDLQQILKHTLLVLEQQIRDKRAFVHVDPLPKLFGDKILILRLFQNLISNSLKFNESDMPIIYVRAKEQKHHWQFSIEDNGIGIEPQYHKVVFDLFKRLHGKAKYEGTGIGLSLCKKIVEAHGGKIWLNPSFQEGTQISFTLAKQTNE